MHTIGIVGGIGPESTVEYYRLMIAAHRERYADGSNPSIIINSIDVAKLLGLFGANDLAGATDYLVEAVEQLARAGASRGLIAANTPHLVFDEVQRRSPIPLVSIVRATCDEVLRLGLTRVALFGTRFTMEGRFYPDVFARAGLTLVMPEPDERAYIHQKYVNELLKSVFLPETRDRLRSIVTTMKDRDRVQAIILGGTELALILKEPAVAGIPLLDTTRIHVQRVMSEAAELGGV
jgi:aspartate racemase